MSNVNENIQKMLIARGFDSDKILEINDFSDISTDNRYICINDDIKIGIKQIKNIEAKMISENVNRAIVFYNSTITAFAKQYLKEENEFDIEMFKIDSMKFCLLDHDLIPEVCIVDDSEKKDLLSFYRIKETNLPRIQFEDPVVRYLGAKKGNVLRFTRPSESAGVYSYWRIVH